MENVYLDSLQKRVNDYNLMLRDHKNLEGEILLKHGKDSEEYRLWLLHYEEIILSKPSYGERIAVEAYEYTKAGNYDCLVLTSSLVDEKTVKSFVDTLRSAGIKKFVLGVKSTSSMFDIFMLNKYGCSILEPCVIDHIEEIDWERYGLSFVID